MGGSISSVEGYRVVHRQPSSPLEEAGLEPYFDFIVQANGIRLSSDSTFSVIVSKSVNCRVFLKVFNIRTKTTREAVVTPKEEWGGMGLLGGEVRFEEWSSEEEFGIRVVQVLPGSVAESAGLVAGTDYIVGTDETSVSNLEELAAQTMKRHSLSLDVFSAATKAVRRVGIHLSEDNPVLGLDLGQGILHSLSDQLEPTADPAVSEPIPQQTPSIPPPPKVTYLQPKEEQKTLPPPPQAAPMKHEEAEQSPKVYLVLGPPSIYEKDDGHFVINVLQSPYIRPADALPS